MKKALLVTLDFPLVRRAAVSAVALSSMFFAAGCMSSPTYGTDKTSGEQLLNDVSNLTKLQPDRGEKIAYNPRPDLVRPENARSAQLPQPQETVASANNPDWVESPEEKRARLRKEIDENRDKPGFKSPIADGDGDGVPNRATASSTQDDWFYKNGNISAATQAAQAEKVRKQIAENNQGSPTTRKYLSEPPIDYRQPAADAPVGDVGEDEWKKERRLKAEARKKSGNTSWRDYVPGF